MRKWLLIGVSAIVINGCGDKADEIPVYTLQLPAIPGAPTIMTPAQAVGSFASAEITVSPLKGTLEQLDSSRYFRYLPSAEAGSGTDSFTLNVTDGNGTQKTINVLVAFDDNEDCIGGGLPDHVQVKPGQKISIDILANDIFCSGRAKADGIAGREVVLSAPFPNPYQTISLNLSGNGTASMGFEAPSDATGTVELIYEVGIGASGPSVDENNHMLPQAFQFFVLAQITIDIIE